MKKLLLATAMSIGIMSNVYAEDKVVPNMSATCFTYEMLVEEGKKFDFIPVDGIEVEDDFLAALQFFYHETGHDHMLDGVLFMTNEQWSRGVLFGFIDQCAVIAIGPGPLRGEDGLLPLLDKFSDNIPPA